MPHRRLVSLLLVLAMVPLIAAAPTVSSQSFTTLTSFQTATISTTYTSLSTVTVQFTTALASTYTSTTTRLLYDESQTLLVKGSGECGKYGEYDFTMRRGEAVRGKVTSSNPIGFFIMTQNDFNAWQNSVGCDVVNALVKVPSTTSYTIDLVAPNDGGYTIVLLNTSTAAAQFTLTARIEGGATPVFTTTSITTRSFSIVTWAVVNVGERVDEFLHTEQVGFSLGANTVLLIVVALIVAIVLLAIIAMRRRRKVIVGPPPAPVHVTSPAVARQAQPSPVEPGGFCANCGAQIMAGARFCKKCGAPTT